MDDELRSVGYSSDLLINDGAGFVVEQLDCPLVYLR